MIIIDSLMGVLPHEKGLMHLLRYGLYAFFNVFVHNKRTGTGDDRFGYL